MKPEGLGQANITPGVNVPAAYIDSNIGYHLYSKSPAMVGGGWTEINSITFSDMVIQIGEMNTTYQDFLWGAGLTAIDAYQLDKKFDDGVPGSGIIRAFDAGQPGVDNQNTTCLSGSSYSSSANTGCNVFYTKVE